MPLSYRQIKDNKFKDQKNSEAKKTTNNTSTNNNNNDGQLLSQLTQAKSTSSQSGKKDFRLYCETDQGQNCNTPNTSINTTMIKKGKKVKVNLSQIEYYNCHRKGYYTNKYPNKKPKN